jgi:hypothetical protein
MDAEVRMSTDREQLAALAARLTPEPDPAPADGDVWAEIIARTSDPRLRALYVERRAQGIARYGVPLQRSNGRSHIVDALQEAVDLVAYCTAADLPGLAGYAEAMVRCLISLAEVEAFAGIKPG